MSEEIFIKEEEPPKPAKKKRVLTEKQREGLAKGRAKMAEKRRLKKEMEAKRKELAALDTKAVKESQILYTLKKRQYYRKPSAIKREKKNLVKLRQKYHTEN